MFELLLLNLAHGARVTAEQTEILWGLQEDDNHDFYKEYEEPTGTYQSVSDNWILFTIITCVLMFLCVGVFAIIATRPTTKNVKKKKFDQYPAEDL